MTNYKQNIDQIFDVTQDGNIARNNILKITWWNVIQDFLMVLFP